MSRPKGTPDYLMAHDAAGYMLGSTCDWPEGYGAVWQALMERQGGTVTRMTLNEYRAWHLAGCQPRIPKPAPAVPAVPTGTAGWYMPGLFEATS